MLRGREKLWSQKCEISLDNAIRSCHLLPSSAIFWKRPGRASVFRMPDVENLRPTQAAARQSRSNFSDFEVGDYEALNFVVKPASSIRCKPSTNPLRSQFSIPGRHTFQPPSATISHRRLQMRIGTSKMARQDAVSSSLAFNQ